MSEPKMVISENKAPYVSYLSVKVIGNHQIKLN